MGEFERELLNKSKKHLRSSNIFSNFAGVKICYTIVGKYY